MIEERGGSRLSDGELANRTRAILYQSARPVDPVQAREQLWTLQEWVRRRSHHQLSPSQWVELGIARRLIEELEAPASEG
jgi:hypothetical protein